MATTITQTMTERVRKLRQQSLDTVETLSIERAELLTEFHKQDLGLMSVPVQRAMAFAYLLEHKHIDIYDGELIVGEKGDKPKAAPTYPELCCHTLEDLDILDTRPLTSFKVSAEARKAQEELIIPFWHGKSIGDLVLDEMTQEWKDAFDAGIFTEFMTQRAPGHTVMDDKIYHNGMLDFQAKIDASLAKLDYLNDPDAYDKQKELKAMRIAAGALIRFGERYSQLAREQAQAESNAVRRQELEKIADVCAHVPAHPPRDFHEALQYYWFVHLGVTTELNTWDSFSPGRLDQHLLPFYEKGLAEGTLTRESAKELLECFWVKFNNQPAPPKVGVTAAESGTYTDFSQINIGGLRPDGSDGVNELSYLVLDVVEEMRLLQPSASIQVSKKSPDRLIKRAAKIIRTGFGQPSIFNTDAIVQELVRMGKDVVDARCGGTSGCVETGAFGKENYNLTGYFNLPKVLELTLHNGFDPRTGKQLGPQTGNPRQFASFDELFSAFEKQVLHFVDIKVRGNQVVERLYANYMPVPFLSLLTDDCITNGKDYHNGGARYNTTYIMGVGIGTMADALAAIKYHVFDEKTFGMDELLTMLEADFNGHERIRQLLLNRTPKYGNDDDYADNLMVRVFDAYFNAVDGRRSTKGGEYHIDMLPTTCHIYFGSVTGALPDGRLAWSPLSEGVSPVQGADRHGPTAAVRSVAKIDHVRTGGTLLNQKFTPQVLESEAGMNGIVHLVRGYFNLDGHHIQFNVVDADTLRAAQKNPEQYRSLIVRVAGYSDYFCDLSKALQDEIIVRTAYEGF
jgi:pyruvate formate-lyase/glycerol dehydratase family glycyl radical enzyme